MPRPDVALAGPGDPGEERTTLFDRLERAAQRFPLRLGGVNPVAVAARTPRRATRIRVTGLAAEMTYYAIISLVPLLTAIGAGLGFLGRLLGQERVAEIESVLIDALGVVFAPEVTADVLAPILRGVLQQERTAVAVAGALVALLLAARMFRSAGRALDAAYGIERPRPILASWLVAILLALTATVVVTFTLALVVVGPLLGGGREIAEALGMGATFELAWAVGRWPLVFVIGVAFLGALYQLAPSVAHGWRAAVPGAALAMVGTVLIALGLRLYFERVGAREIAPDEPAEAVSLVGQVLGGVLVGALWAWLTNVVVLLGGVVNAELVAERRRAA